jgi:hypothetical protein
VVKAANQRRNVARAIALGARHLDLDSLHALDASLDGALVVRGGADRGRARQRVRRRRHGRVPRLERKRGTLPWRTPARGARR